MSVRLSTRIALFFYSTSNIIGCLCALAVLALYFTGIIRAWWMPLTFGAYVFGWLAAPKRVQPSLAQLPQMSLPDAIDLLVRELAPRLPADAQSRLREIQSQVHELAPRMAAEGFPMDARIEINNAVTRDLPSSLSSYLALPPGFARLHVVREGKTSHGLLLEQLALLHEELRDMAAGVFGRDADKLVAQGEYLKQKFRPLEFIER